MPDEKKEGDEKKETSLIYGGLALVVVIATLVFFFQAVIWIVVGFFVGIVLAVFSNKTSTKDLMLYGIIFAVFGALLFTYWSTIYAGIGKVGMSVNIASLFTEAKKPFECLFDFEKCKKQYEYSSSIVVESPKIYTKVNFQSSNYVRENKPIDLDTEVVVMNQVFDNLLIKAECLVNNASIEARPSSFVFSKSTKEQFSTLNCYGEFKKGELEVRLGAQYKAETVLSVDVGTGENTGKKVSDMMYDSPYKLSIGLNYNQPLRTGEYTMFIILEKQFKEKIKHLDSLNVSTIMEKTTISCEDIPELQITNLDKTALKDFLIDPNKDIYLWKCTLNIAEGEGTGYIQAEAIYTAESEYTTALQVIK